MERLMNMHQTVDFREFARSLGTPIQYSTGNVVFHEGDAPRFMYIVLSGAVEIDAHGKHIEDVGAGDAFGILSLLDRRPRNITARAKVDSEVAVIDEKRFRYMVEEIPHFVWYVMDELAQRLRNTNAQL
jgi:CRP/FNR family transcriptional regulator, cyclic AMP receptor protein